MLMLPPSLQLSWFSGSGAVTEILLAEALTWAWRLLMRCIPVMDDFPDQIQISLYNYRETNLNCTHCFQHLSQLSYLPPRQIHISNAYLTSLPNYKVTVWLEKVSFTFVLSVRDFYGALEVPQKRQTQGEGKNVNCAQETTSKQIDGQIITETTEICFET